MGRRETQVSVKDGDKKWLGVQACIVNSFARNEAHSK